MIWRTIKWVLLFSFLWFASAVTHEADLARNFNKTGDAKAFFFEIKCGKEGTP